MSARPSYAAQVSKFYTRASRFAAGAALLLGSAAGFARETMRPMHPSELLVGTKVDVGYRVKTARVITFNRAALERDFPSVRGLGDLELEHWILNNFAYVNSVQLRLTGIRNTSIDIDHQDRKAIYVPPGVGRGGMVEVDGEGLVDLKAIGNSSWNEAQIERLIARALESEKGMLEVRNADHVSGLERHGLSAAEYIRQNEIQADYNARNARSDGPHAQTTENYFDIDLGFRIIYPDGEFPAAMIGREAVDGRSAGNRPLENEIYTDKGTFQASYAGTRIDFGGARTRSEAQVTYHDRAQAIPVERVKGFIEAELRRFGPSTSYATAAPMSDDAMSELLNTRVGRFDRGPDPGAIGVHNFDMDSRWRIDVPEVAHLKWTLFRLSAGRLNGFLSRLSEGQLQHLFYLARVKFTMPLPELAYAFGLAYGGAVRSSAVSSAALVLERFPNLIPPTVAAALDDLAHAGYWMPGSVNALVEVESPFPGFERFLRAVLSAKHNSSSADVVEHLASHFRGTPMARRLLKFIAKTETDPKVLKALRSRFTPDYLCPNLLVRLPKP